MPSLRSAALVATLVAGCWVTVSATRSAERAKGDTAKPAAAAASAAAPAPPAAAASAPRPARVPNACDAWSCTYVIQGPIKASTLDELRNFLVTRAQNLPLLVHFDSPGGDLGPAIAIGRLLRANAPVSGTVYTGTRCIGACVLALAGTTTRSVDGAEIGLHRLYAPEVKPPKDSRKPPAPPAASPEAELRAYLNEVNVPVQLLDEAAKHEPQSPHALTVDELSRFRIAGTDWVWQEQEDAIAAERYKTDKVTYRQRRLQASRQCDLLLRDPRSTPQWEERDRCRQAVLEGAPAVNATVAASASR